MSSELVTTFPLVPDAVPLRPPPTPVRYEALISWETYANGAYQCATIGKQVTLWGQPHAAGFVFELHTRPPTLTKLGDREPLENLALRLAALYAHIVVQTDAAGEVVELLNHAALQQAGAQLAQQVRADTGGAEAVTEALLGFMERQLASPALTLDSLRHDYLYQALLPACYARPLAGATVLPQSRQFASFFDKIPLWFAETSSLQPAAEVGQLLLRRAGILDEQKTDLPAVQRCLADALRQAEPPPGTPPLPAELPAPHFHYEAAYILEAATGLPLQGTLRVYARAGLLFNKEYTLTLTRS